MMKEVLVLSLGGSLIVPEKIDPSWIDKFRSLILKFTHRYKFVIVCGGGFVAREYIEILKSEHKSRKRQSLAGIDVTRMNAKVMMGIFGKSSNAVLPLTMKRVKDLLAKNNIVFTGALRYAPNQTSDSTAAKIANYLKTNFVNLTNVDGLYDSNPLKNKNAKFIKDISWGDFYDRASKIKYSPGQHFVLDQKASKVIKDNNITTYILGKNIQNLNKFLNKQKFVGTTITGI